MVLSTPLLMGVAEIAIDQGRRDVEAGINSTTIHLRMEGEAMRKIQAGMDRTDVDGGTCVVISGLLSRF